MKNYEIADLWMEMANKFEQRILDAWSETVGADLVMEIGGDDGEVVWDGDWEEGFEMEERVMRLEGGHDRKEAKEHD